MSQFVENPEQMAHPELLDVVLDEQLCALSECLLHLADADDATAGIDQAV